MAACARVRASAGESKARDARRLERAKQETRVAWRCAHPCMRESKAAQPGGRALVRSCVSVRRCACADTRECGCVWVRAWVASAWVARG
eukprot:4065721-Pleurochrysis_carterae.AAC.1